MGGQTPRLKAPLEAVSISHCPSPSTAKLPVPHSGGSSFPFPLKASPSTHTRSRTSKQDSGFVQHSPRSFERSEGKNKVRSVGREQGISGKVG